MGKSTTRTRNYRGGASRRPVALATLRDQMADYARAERLRELRAATHLSREKVAAEIGVTTKTLYEWENGGSIRWDNAKKLGAFYKVDPEGLVSREPGAAASSSTVNGDVPDDLRQQVQDLHAKVDRIIDALGLDKDADQHPLDQISEIAGALPELLAADDETAAATETDSAGS
jgi:transcriptional regulator with XRE-family HTH domain